MNKKITISIVCYNAASTIENAIKSVLNQNYNNYELVIVDGGSKDGTLDIIRTYPSIRFVSEPDKGVYDAMNNALRMAD